jgi:hypothetical protein
MPKLYHVISEEDEIISSWKTHDEAVLAIRHLLNPNIVSHANLTVRGMRPIGECYFQEEDLKDGYWAISADHPSVRIRHSVEKGTAGKS